MSESVFQRSFINSLIVLISSGTAAVVNVGTVSAILLNRALRKRQNVFTFNLALADCVSSVALFFSTIHRFPGIRFLLGNFSWDIPVFAVGLIISILSTLAIAFERLIVLRVDALGRRQLLTAKRSITICVIGWVVLPSTLLIIHQFNRSLSRALMIVVAPCVILLCLAITTFCYIVIYKKIATISENIGLNDAALRHRAKNSQKILVTFALVVASTSVCWVFLCTCLIVQAALWGPFGEPLWFRTFKEVSYTLVPVNGLLNPAIIWLRLTEFRGQLNACFGRRPCHRIDDSQDASIAQSDATTQQISISMINTGVQDTTKN